MPWSICAASRPTTIIGASSAIPAGATTTCCRYFKKAERNERLHDEFHGADGPLNVAERPYTNPLSHAFVEAAQQAGLPFNPDFNGATQLGCGLFQVTQKNGRRWSAASAYLHPVAARENLTILTKAQATRVLIENGRAVGVEYVRGRKRHIARAEQEVVLAGGAINSPQLLLLSGIGPAEELRALGVSVALDLPGVGKNLQDHLNVNIVRARQARQHARRQESAASRRSAWRWNFCCMAPGRAPAMSPRPARSRSAISARRHRTSSIISFRRRWSITPARRWTATASPCMPAASARKAAAKSVSPRAIRCSRR